MGVTEHPRLEALEEQRRGRPGEMGRRGDGSPYESEDAAGDAVVKSAAQAERKGAVRVLVGQGFPHPAVHAAAGVIGKRPEVRHHVVNERRRRQG